MRMVGTALVCIAAAFGAAFLVAQAADHHSAAKAATLPKLKTQQVTVPKLANTAKLAVYFKPALNKLKLEVPPKPKPHKRRIKHTAKVHKQRSTTNDSSVTPPIPTETTTSTTPVTPAPVVTHTSDPTTTPTPAPKPVVHTTTTSHTTTTPHRSGGSGKTTIG